MAASHRTSRLAARDNQRCRPRRAPTGRMWLGRQKRNGVRLYVLLSHHNGTSSALSYRPPEPAPPPLATCPTPAFSHCAGTPGLEAARSNSSRLRTWSGRSGSRNGTGSEGVGLVGAPRAWCIYVKHSAYAPSMCTEGAICFPYCSRLLWPLTMAVLTRLPPQPSHQLLLTPYSLLLATYC